MANFSPRWISVRLARRSARVAVMKVAITRRRFQPGSKILARFQKPGWDFDNWYKYCCSISETSYRPEIELPPTELGSFRYPVEFLHKVRWLKRPQHHITIYDIWPGIRSGQKDFHHSRTLHKKKYSLLRREVNEEKNLSHTFETLFRKFLHSRNICLREMNRPTNRQKCRKIFENCAFWSISAVIDYSFLLITSTAYYKRTIPTQKHIRVLSYSFRTIVLSLIVLKQPRKIDVPAKESQYAAWPWLVTSFSCKNNPTRETPDASSMSKSEGVDKKMRQFRTPWCSYRSLALYYVHTDLSTKFSVK